MALKKETFEEFLADSFVNDVYFRELRLTEEEADYVLKKYPKAGVKKSSTEVAADGKCWYEVNLLPSNPPVSEQASLAAENQRLKEELEALKKSLSPVK